MTLEQEQELLEHQKDSDYNRASHFKEYTKLMKIYSLWNNCRLILSIILTIIYVTYFSMPNLYPNILKGLGFIIALILTIISIVLDNKNYIENAHRNWLAAQSYQNLYRDCQFFKQFPQKDCDDNLNYGIYRIRKQLNTLNLLSPHIGIFLTEDESQKIENKYKKKNIQNLFLKTVIEKEIKIIFKKKLINIYIFGNNNNIEIDVTIIMLDKYQTEEVELLKNLNDLQLMILKKYSIYLDINLFTQVNFYSYKELPFNSNVCKGDLILNLIKNSNYNINIKEKIKTKINLYKSIITDEFNKTNSKNEIIIFGLYYCYYHLIVLILVTNKISWNSEKEMIQNFIHLIKKDDKLRREDIKNYLLVIQLKNIILHNYFDYGNVDLLKLIFKDFKNFYIKNVT